MKIILYITIWANKILGPLSGSYLSTKYHYIIKAAMVRKEKIAKLVK